MPDSERHGSTVYTTEPCGFCRQAKALLQSRGVDYSEVNLAKDPGGPSRLVALTGQMTFPQIVVGERAIGGFRELLEADREGSLSDLLDRAADGPRPRLAALADVGAAPGGAHLPDRVAAARARLALARVHEEAVLERALGAVGIAEVVDRGALGVDPGLQRLRPPRRAAPRAAGRFSVPTGPQRVDAARGTAPRRRRCCPRRRSAPGSAGTP